MNKKAKILICEDDKAINKLLSLTMEIEGYTYRSVESGKQCLREIVKEQPDVLLLDLGLPDMDGDSIITEVREFSDFPIIVISAREEETDKVTALDAGADDYLTKPFSTEELLARLRASYRRARLIEKDPHKKAELFKNGWLTINFLSQEVFIEEEKIHLTPIEYKLLVLLANNLNRVLTYRFITSQIWGYSEDDHSALRVFATTLRKKIELEPSQAKLIQTHIGIGYRMVKLEK
ncbi:response regulator [Lactococcus hircilactis]|uniref:response regulator n=1 Tax=Lactococcus hircilactis TaxID=1494462 RepID=UPI003FA1DC86